MTTWLELEGMNQAQNQTASSHSHEEPKIITSQKGKAEVTRPEEGCGERTSTRCQNAVRHRNKVLVYSTAGSLFRSSVVDTMKSCNEFKHKHKETRYVWGKMLTT